MVTLAHLVAALPAVRSRTPTDSDELQVSAVTADSRAVTPGALFVAVRGGTVDGHAYLADAYAQGAVAGIGEYAPGELAALGHGVPATWPYIQVEDSRRALAFAAAALLGFPSRDLVVVGVTGTDGKTTTCTLIESILTAATRAPGAEGAAGAAAGAGAVGVITTVAARIRGQASETGFHVTTPDAPEVQRYLAEMRDAGCRYAVVESTSHGLDQGRVDAVDFDIAAVTNITHEHLDYHGTREAYVQAKARLFRMVSRAPVKPGAPRGVVLNADDAGSYGALQAVLDEEDARGDRPAPRRAYGLRSTLQAARTAVAQGEVDVAAAEVRYSPARTEFMLVWWGGEFRVETPLIGEFNVYNVLCAAAAALALEIVPAQIQAGVAAMSGVSGRMERIDAGQPFLAVVDFAHSPASLERALHTLRPLVGTRRDGQPGRLIAVFGCAGLRDRAKRPLMGGISGRLADFTVITAEDPRTENLDAINAAIAEGLTAAAPTAAYAIVPDRAAAIQVAVDMAEPGDVVAAFGKGHERSMCFGVEESPWSDQAAMQAALERRAQPRGAGA